MGQRRVESWTVVSETVYTHSPYRKIKDVVFELPHGQQRLFSLKLEGTCVCVLPFTVSGRVLLARQYRPGPDAILDELPGGGVDTGESMMDAVRRELLEETGYEAEHVIALGSVYECAYSTIQRQGFVALGCRQVADPKPDENEFTEPIEKDLDEFTGQLMAGQLTDPEVAWMALFKLGLIARTQKSVDGVDLTETAKPVKGVTSDER